MKSGAGDDPFATEDDASDSDDASDGEDASGDEHDVGGDDGVDGTTTTGFEQSRPESGGGLDQQTPPPSEPASELPYKYRRDSVKDGRTQQPMFLQDETESLIEEIVDDVESQFDERVYKTDVVEAMIVAGGEETTPEAVLRRWGYGMKNS